MAQDPRCATPARVSELREAWRKLRERVGAFTRPNADQQLVIGLREYQNFLAMIDHRADHASLGNVAKSWTYESTATLFSRLENQIQRLGERLGKRVRLVLQHHDVRLRARPLTEFLASLAHIIRNGVDHGIEPPEARRARGKAVVGTITVRTEIVGSELVLSIADDGAGIDWSLVARSARDKGLPHRDQADLVAAILHDGLSTRSKVDETSGRGVGLSAVREAYLALGGSLDVRSVIGAGTEFVFRFPLSLRSDDESRVVAWAPASAAASSSAIERASLPG
jgi:signal transduction histidine kinase